MLDRSSAAEAARDMWQRKPRPEELPKLRSTSDIAFGFWNRVATAATRSNVKYIMSCFILNAHTEETMRAALDKINARNLDTQVWPGRVMEGLRCEMDSQNCPALPWRMECFDEVEVRWYSIQPEIQAKSRVYNSTFQAHNVY